MARKRKKGKKQHLDPHAVLQGHVNIRPLELIRLIHRVNPTNEDLSFGERLERYQLKSRLQCLLVEKFGDRLDVEQPDPENPALISLKLKHFDEDACHAILHELDQDARSWVQRRIDEKVAASTDEQTGSQSKTGKRSTVVKKRDTPELRSIEGCSTEELLRMGRDALEAYDYDGCEGYLRRACDLAYDDPEPVRALLELYVDHLAAYKKAIALGRTLSPHVKKDEEVRGLYALALARGGQVEQAIDSLAGTMISRGPEVYLLAGFHFAEQENYERAVECHGVLVSSELPGLTSEMSRLEDAIVRLRAKRLKPVEEAMLQVWEQGERQQAAQYADELLAQWPGNSEAQRICGLFAEQQRKEEICRLMEQADAARARKEYEREQGFLERVLQMTEDDESVAGRYRQAIEDAKIQQQEADTAAILDLLASGRLRDALLHYCALSLEQQQRVMNEHGDERMSWLTQLIKARSIVKPEKMVAAVIALGEAREMLIRDSDPDTILSLIFPHEKTLHPVPEAAEALLQSEERARSREARKAGEQLHEAGRLLQAGDRKAARACLDAIVPSALHNDEQLALGELRASLQRIEECHALKSVYAMERSRGDHFAARKTARRLAEIIDPEETAQWLDKAQEHSASLKAEWRLSRLNVGSLPVEYQMVFTPGDIEDKCAVLFGNSNHLLYVASCGHWLILFLFDLDMQQHEQAIVLRTPVALSYEKVVAAGSTIWVWGESGAVLELSIEPLDILFWHDFSGDVREGEVLDFSWLFPRSRRLWLNVRESVPMGKEVTRIINMDQQRVERSCNLSSIPVIFRHGDEFRLADAVFHSRTLGFYSEQGQPVGEITRSGDDLVSGVIRHPDGAGYIVMSYANSDFDPFWELTKNKDPEEEYDSRLFLEIISDNGEISPPMFIQDSLGERSSGVFQSSNEGLVFVHYHGVYGVFIQAWELCGKAMNMLYEIPVSGHFMLAGDEFSRRVAAVNMHTGGVEAQVLGREKPRFAISAGECSLRNDIPSSFPFCSCDKPTGAMKAQMLSYMAQLKHAPDEIYDSVIEQLKVSGNPDDMAALIYALERSLHLDTAQEQYRWFEKRYPDHPKTRINRAVEALRNQQWSESVDHLEDVPRDKLNDGLACHVCHLLGFGLWGMGFVQEALDVWEEGAGLERGGCALMPYIEYARLAIRLSRKGKKARNRGDIPEIIQVYVDVDDALAREDWLAVIARFEQYSFSSLTDIQLLARFAEAYLHINCADDGRRLGKLMVLARYHWEYNHEGPHGVFLLPPSIQMWPRYRLQDVADRAAEWLDGTQSQ